MIVSQQDTKVSLEKEIQMIFKHVCCTAPKQRVVFKVKEVTKIHIKELITQALKRAILRDASMSALQPSDLLAVIQKQNEKYRMNVGKYLIDANLFSEFNTKKKLTDNLNEESAISEEENQ